MFYKICQRVPWLEMKLNVIKGKCINGNHQRRPMHSAKSIYTQG